MDIKFFELLLDIFLEMKILIPFIAINKVSLCRLTLTALFSFLRK